MEAGITNNILEFWRNTSEDPFQVLFERAPIMMHSIDHDGRLMQVSNFWARQLGYDIDEMVGRKSIEFLTPECRKYAETTGMPKLMASGAIHNLEYEFVRKDGSILSALLSATTINEGDEKAEPKNPRSLAIIFDNTEAKRALALLNQKQRSEMLGRLASGIAHDFSNILSVILGSLEALQDDFENPEREIVVLDAIRATRRGASLTQQLLSFGRQAGLKPRVIDVNRAVRDLESMLSRVFPANIEIETLATSGLWPARVDQPQLETAILNLATNARDAMPDGGTFTLETSNITVTEASLVARNGEIAPGDYTTLCASDTGVGIPPELVERVFEPFFSTKAPGAGSGMGLAMVQGFAEQSSGAVHLRSEAGFGTSIRLYFPAVMAAQVETSDRADGTGLSSLTTNSGPHVLVVEDGDDVRKVVVTQLRALGYRVTEAGSGDLAMSLLEAGDRPDLLLTDVVLSGSLQGPTLVAEARKLIPDLRVLYVSGYPDDAQNTGETGHDTRLMKPVGRAQLARAVKTVLA